MLKLFFFILIPFFNKARSERPSVFKDTVKEVRPTTTYIIVHHYKFNFRKVVAFHLADKLSFFFFAYSTVTTRIIFAAETLQKILGSLQEKE